MNINGSLRFDASGLSQIENLRLEKIASLPTWGSSDVGRLVYVTGSQVIYLGGASAWISLATGGNAAALQSEVDAIETTLGASINGDGTFANNFVGAAFSSPTSFTQAINQLAAFATSNDTLAELDDVALSSLSTGQYLRYNGTAWVNDTLDTTDINGVTASAAEVNILTGTTVSAAELNFVDGVTSSIQTQLDNKQALDAGLTSLSALTATGIIVQTADNVFAARTLSAPTEGFTITNPAGIGGNPTFALANDLAALEGLATLGYVVRDANGSATTRSFSGTAGNIVVTNGDGVTSDTSLDLAAITQATSGTFSKVTLDGFGRVTGNTPVVSGDITGLVNSIYVNTAGDTMTGDLAMGGFKVTGLGAPTSAGDAATKNYVDAAVTGMTWEAPVDEIVADHTTVTPVGKPNGYRVVNSTTNTIYTVTAGAYDAGEALVDGGAFFDRTNETGYVFNGTTLTQFTGGGQLTAGIGLVKTGNVLDVNLGAGITQLPSDEVGIDLFNTATGGLVLTTDGTTRSGTNAAGQLFLLTGAASGLAQSALGLFIAATGVTNAMLANSTVGLNGDTGTSSLALGQTLQIIGSSASGLSSVASGQTVTFSILDASSSQKGVATFNTADFAVTAGDVTIKAAGVDNAQLANSTITLTGTTGSDTVALGESLAVNGDGAAITTVVAANAVTVSVRDATTVLKGVASFATADFDVTAGAVSITPKGLDNLTDVAVTSATTGDTLVHNGTNFVNRKIYFLYQIDASTPAASAAVHTVTHNLGQSFCNVTVVDATNNVVIPESIVFNTTNQLTVTFNTAIACRVIVMGVA